MIPITLLSKMSSCSLLIMTHFCFSQTSNLAPLSEMREKIVFPELSPTEKRLLASQAQILLRDLYVHRSQKQEYYNQVIDPVPAIEKVVKVADKLSVQELEHAIYRIFCEQRDLHLNYLFPAPYNQFTSFIPITLERTAGAENDFEVRVGAVNRSLIQQYAPGQRVPAIGDEIITYNGSPVLQEIKRLLPITQGSNRFGGFARALQGMTMLSHKRREVPDSNEVTLVFKPYSQTGTPACYTLKLPWLTRHLVRQEEGEKKMLLNQLAKRMRLGADEDQEEVNHLRRALDLEPKSVYPKEKTREPQLLWGKITNADGHFGYFKLNSFVPTTGRYHTINEICHLLHSELANTDGLIFDVRNNGGGDIAFADTLPQLFTPTNARTLAFRLLNTGLNHRIFSQANIGGPNSEFIKALDEVKDTEEEFTRPVPYTSEKAANQVGQAYYKPVALLTNAKCYSATDMFSCGLQDNGGCLVFGEDPRTGAGGANVMPYGDFLALGIDDVFKPLPKDHAMRVSWRQNVRFGPHEGEIIEDFGCQADYDVSQTVEDLLNGNSHQLSKITRVLAERRESSTPSARAESSSTEIYLPSDAQSYQIFAKNTPEVRIYREGVLQTTLEIGAEEEEKAVGHALTGLKPGKVWHLTFEGVDDEGNVLWNLKRTLIRPEKKITIGAEGFKLDFSAEPDLSALSILHKEEGTPKDGWNLAGPYLQIGYTPDYIHNLNCEAIIFANLKGKTFAKLEWVAEYDTEPGTDYFIVSVAGEKRKRTLLSAAGKKEMTHYSFDISEFAGQDNVAISFCLASDSEFAGKGVRIKELCIK